MQVFSETNNKNGTEKRAEQEDLLARLAAPAGSDLPSPRILFVLAHPDDEVIAVGGRLERMQRSHLVTVTDGAPQNGEDAHHHGFAELDGYREARRTELMAALAHAGLKEAFVLPFRAQVSDQAASHNLVELTCAIAEVIELVQPEAVLTHPYEGGHPDHDACAFAAHNAVRLIRTRQSVVSPPILVEAPFYNVGDNGSMRTGSFLPNTEGTGLIAALTEAEAQHKRERLAFFKSQAETLAQFETEQEQYRIAPAYDFTAPPHQGKLLYEFFTWGVTGAQFRALARQAMDRLFPRQGQDNGDEASFA